MGRSNYAQFGNKVHVGQAHVRTKADHASRKDDHLLDGNRQDGRDEKGRVVGCTDSTTREATGGRATSKGEGKGNADEKQGTVRLDVPIVT